MTFPDQNQIIDIRNTLVDLATFRIADRTAGGKPDPIHIRVIYTHDNLIYRNGRIIEADASVYANCKKFTPNDLVNKFGKVYNDGVPLLLHKKFASVIVDAAIDIRDRLGLFTVVMDGLRTYDSNLLMQQNRPDLVKAGLLALAGNSAHNRALAADSKLFEYKNGELIEADEHGHLDDLDMTTNSRFYTGPMSDTARRNRLHRLQAWQRASIKNKLPVANLLAEFWDDRLPGSPADMWRVLSCRALCVGADGNPKTNPAVAQLRDDLQALHKHQEEGKLTRHQFAHSAHATLVVAWDKVFSLPQKQELEMLLGNGGGKPPPLADFLFHEWLETINDDVLEQAFGFRQAASLSPAQAAPSHR